MVKEIELAPSVEPPSQKSAAEIFANLGRWSGETTEEILTILAEARRSGGQRDVSEL